jgi:hypothetical protein
MAGREKRVSASTRHPNHDLTVGRGRVWPALSLSGAATRTRGDRVRAPDAGLDPLALFSTGFLRSSISITLGGAITATVSAALGAASLTGARVTETKAAQC